MPNFPITDTHLHLWDTKKLNYDWIKSIKLLNRSFSLSDYDQHCQPVDVDRMVFVQCDCDDEQGIEEARWVADLAQKDSRIQGIVAFAPIEKEEQISSYLNQLVKVPLVKGVRRLLQVINETGFCLSANFVNGINMLADFGLSFDICCRHDQLEEIVQLVDQCPKVSFMLDHIGGSPDLIASNYRESWSIQIQKLAQFDNVYCKVSGIVTTANHQNWSTDDLSPYVDDVISAFGWDRLVYGGDWPVSTLAATYPQWINALDEIVEGASDQQKKQLYRENAGQFYRL